MNLVIINIIRSAIHVWKNENSMKMSCCQIREIILKEKVKTVINSESCKTVCKSSATISCLLDCPLSRPCSNMDASCLFGLWLLCVFHLSPIRSVLWCWEWQQKFLTTLFIKKGLCDLSPQFHISFMMKLLQEAKISLNHNVCKGKSLFH